ncbi:MAG: TIGR02266 family protein [Deltaproteobacteria bacterium]|nr:TIGR02266 family protein [Deltaproteobacteria bacterium]
MLLKVEYKHAADFLEAYTENVSEGGVFIATEDSFHLGQIIEFSVSFPGLLDPIPVKGQVKWSRPNSGESPAGIGVQFMERTDLSQLASDLRDQPSRENAEPVTFRVLLVEDNAVVRDMFRYAIEKISRRGSLSPARMEVLEAGNGKDAWDLLRRQRCHLVVVDLYMPIMDGGQLIEYIRRDEYLKNTPVLVVSSGGREGRSRAVSSGADVYLDKPIKLKDMMETIETLIIIGHYPK